MGGKQRMSKKYLYYFSEGNDAFGGDKVTMKLSLIHISEPTRP